jgi:hypothetical protein
MAKAAFNNKMIHQQIGLNLGNKLTKCYNCSTPLYGAATWTLRKAYQIHSGTSVHERLSSRTNRFTNASHHEQIGSRTNFRKKKKTSRVTNGVSSNEHSSRQHRLVTGWEYRRESVSCCVTFAQYT